MDFHLSGRDLQKKKELENIQDQKYGIGVMLIGAKILRLKEMLIKRILCLKFSGSQQKQDQWLHIRIPWEL